MSNSLPQTIYQTALTCQWAIPNALALLVVAQSKHETNEYTSNAFKQDNDCFGYKRFIGSRFQEGGGIKSSEGDPYAQYKSVIESTEEICAWLHRHFKNLNSVTTPEGYAQALKKIGYYGAPESEYAHGLNKYFQKVIS
jgi:hypothetical protein